MSNIVKENFIKKLEGLYFKCVEEIQESPDYQQKVEDLVDIRNDIIAMGVSEETVDELIEAAVEKTTTEFEYVGYNVPDIFAEPNSY